jgi:beta-glucanase (GH16 family)
LKRDGKDTGMPPMRKERYRNAAYAKENPDWRREQKYARYTSASLITKGKADWTYGRIEVRAKLPMGRGLWPAFWTLGSDVNEIGWPACGEIDIMENYGFDTNSIYGTVHTDKYNHLKASHKGGKTTIPAPYESFHVYAVEWDRKEMNFFVDGQKYFSFLNEGTGEDVWPFDKPHYLIINVAVGGKMGGSHGIDEDVFPQRLYVDYVRVFKKKDGEGKPEKVEPKMPSTGKQEEQKDKE